MLKGQRRRATDYERSRNEVTIPKNKEANKRQHLLEQGDIEPLLCAEAKNSLEHINLVNVTHIIPLETSRCYSLEQEYVSSFRPR